jgi:hypothetical protein
MKTFVSFVFVALFSICSSSSAQVKVCIDAKGKKTFTDYECEKIGMQRADVIQDINITPKQCPAIKDSISNTQAAIARHDATSSNVLNVASPMYRNALVQQLEASQQRYHRECER